ncbi:DNA-binding protein [Massilia sp. 9096]|uniref:DNA-binding protein n=1 Tax=Massilia sp. 9096 TaxID=1500894 RepID=UPI00056373A6|nr:DNA-binding protein [Massilia sp. 9096]
MAEHDVTFDAIHETAERLAGEGRQVSIETVREELGGGNLGEIGRALAGWRAGRLEAAPTPDTGIPEPVAAALAGWLQRYAEDSGAPAREALAQSQADIDALLSAHGELENEREQLEIANTQAQAAIADRDETIARLDAELRNAKQVAMDALVSKAKDQLAIEGKDKQIDKLRNELERNVTESASVSDARLAAEMELVGATTARDSLANEVKDLRGQLDALHADRSSLRAEIEILRKRG